MEINLRKVVTACVSLASLVDSVANVTFYEVLMGQLSEWADTQSLVASNSSPHY